LKEIKLTRGKAFDVHFNCLKNKNKNVVGMFKKIKEKKISISKSLTIVIYMLRRLTPQNNQNILGIKSYIFLTQSSIR